MVTNMQQLSWRYANALCAGFAIPAIICSLVSLHQKQDADSRLWPCFYFFTTATFFRSEFKSPTIFLAEVRVIPRREGGGGGFRHSHFFSSKRLLAKSRTRKWAKNVYVKMTPLFFEVVWWSTLVVKPTVTTKFVSVSILPYVYVKMILALQKKKYCRNKPRL